MRLKVIFFGLTATFLGMNAATDVLQSPYLQFPKKMVPAAYATNPSAYASDMIAKGATVYRQIVQGQIDTARLQKNPAEYVKSITALVFYFFSKAIEKKQGFSSGTLVIKDPGFKVYDFLYKYVEAKWKPRDMVKEVLVDISGVGAYPRKSTHFNSFYIYTDRAKKGLLGKITKKNEFVHYGIDLPKNLILPTQRKHILFGKVEINPPLTFIKLEHHGLGKKGVVLHAKQLGKARMRKFVGKTTNKLKKLGFKEGSYLGKLLDHFSEVSSDDSADARRERIPLAMLTEFLALMLSEGSPIKKDDIDSKGVKGLGIRRMLTILDTYVAGQQGTPAWKAALREFAAQIRKNYDHTDIRLGREVILTPDVELIQS